MNNPYPWYDSDWLCAYSTARDIVAQLYPEQLVDFIGAFQPLRTSPNFTIKHLPRVFDDNTLSEIRHTINSLALEIEVKNMELLEFGRFISRCHEDFRAIHIDLTKTVSDLVGEPVEPLYNFLSLYNNLGVCDVHMDSPEAKWTLDVCIDQSAVWPIYFSQTRDWPEALRYFDDKDEWKKQIKNDPENIFTAYELHPNEAIIFSGSSQWHYRERIPRSRSNNYCHLLFFHFIPEGTRELVDPSCWARLFNMPELAETGAQYPKGTLLSL